MGLPEACIAVDYLYNTLPSYTNFGFFNFYQFEWPFAPSLDAADNCNWFSVSLYHK